MHFDSLGKLLGDEIESPDEETFELFAQELPSQNLGFVDSKATALELTVAGRDLTIQQSPSVLSSNRAGGTTGAVVWKITPLFAEWLCAPRNPLFATGVLSAQSAVLELGCGVSAILGLVLAPRVARYVLTDQPYVARFVEQNIAANHHSHHHHTPDRSRAGKARKAKGGGASSSSSAAAAETDQHLRFAPLDWERDAVTASLAGGAGDARGGFDVVVACDCIYNDALIDPLVSTCADVCRLGRQPPDGVVVVDQGRGEQEEDPPRPCVCVVGQQLRDPDIFEQWLVRFARDFRVWRVPDALLTEGLRSDSGFVVHVGILRNLGGEDAIKDIGYRALLH